MTHWSEHDYNHDFGYFHTPQYNSDFFLDYKLLLDYKAFGQYWTKLKLESKIVKYITPNSDWAL